MFNGQVYCMLKDMKKRNRCPKAKKRTGIFLKKKKNQMAIHWIKISMDKLSSWLSTDGEKISELEDIYEEKTRI